MVGSRFERLACWALEGAVRPQPVPDARGWGERERPRKPTFLALPGSRCCCVCWLGRAKHGDPTLAASISQHTASAACCFGLPVPALHRQSSTDLPVDPETAVTAAASENGRDGRTARDGHCVHDTTLHCIVHCSTTDARGEGGEEVPGSWARLSCRPSQRLRVGVSGHDARPRLTRGCHAVIRDPTGGSDGNRPLGPPPGCL